MITETCPRCTGIMQYNHGYQGSREEPPEQAGWDCLKCHLFIRAGKQLTAYQPPMCLKCGAIQHYSIVAETYNCTHCEGGLVCQCGEWVEQHDATAGGADSNYGSGAAAEFDYPITEQCEGCGLWYCDGDQVEEPRY